MDTYFEPSINKMKMNNQSGTVCSLECYYKVNKEDAPKRVGSTGYFSVGQSKTLELTNLNIPENAWVTAFANIKLANDNNGDCWFHYKSSNDTTAEFTLGGTASSSNVTYNGLSDQYKSEGISHMKLNNQSGTVCSLECYYKVNQGDTPKRIGGTNSFPVGQNSTLDLTNLDIPSNAWVTAFANVSAGKDCNGNIWFQCQKEKQNTAEYTISGVINYTTISFDQLTPNKLMGTMEGYNSTFLSTPSLDHTYVYAKEGDYFKAYSCWGGNSGGKMICQGRGDLIEAETIAGGNGSAGILYLITGVCHQTANRILYPAGITVRAANGYALSCFFYGEYGIGSFKQLETLTVPESDTYFNKVREINLRYNKMEQTDEIFVKRSVEGFLLLAETCIGKEISLDENALKDIIHYKCCQMELLKAKLTNNEISERKYGEELNDLAYDISMRIANIMSDEDFKSIFNYEKGFKQELVDVTKL